MREEADSGIIMDMDRSDKKKGGEKEERKEKVGGESVYKQRVFNLTKGGDAGGLEELHEKGGWPDVEMAVGSGKGDDGNMWHLTALAVAATHNQLEVARVLIKMGAKVNEEREWYALPSCLAAAITAFQVTTAWWPSSCPVHNRKRSHWRTNSVLLRAR